MWAEGRGPQAALPLGGAERAARMRRSNGSQNCVAILGEVAEWSNALAWKASRPDEGLGSSNLPLSELNFYLEATQPGGAYAFGSSCCLDRRDAGTAGHAAAQGHRQHPLEQPVQRD